MIGHAVEVGEVGNLGKRASLLRVARLTNCRR